METQPTAKSRPQNPRFDYDLQVWYDADTNIILDCAHPESMSTPTRPCCHARRWAGEKRSEVKA